MGVVVATPCAHDPLQQRPQLGLPSGGTVAAVRGSSEGMPLGKEPSQWHKQGPIKLVVLDRQACVPELPQSWYELHPCLEDGWSCFARCQGQGVSEDGHRLRRAKRVVPSQEAHLHE
eukprot:15484123-Alexandrium_andersonii.AAC.1